MPYTDHYEKYLNEIPGNIEKCKETGDRIVFGYTSDLDVLLTYNEDEFNKLVDTYVKGDIYRDGDENITDLESFSRIIAYYMANGLGGEADITDHKVVEYLLEHFEHKFSLGGTGAQGAAAMASVGMPLIAHISDKSEQVCDLMDYEGLNTIVGDKQVPMKTIQQGDPVYHVVFSYTKGDGFNLHGKRYTVPIANRVILDYDTIHKDIVVSEDFKKYIEKKQNKAPNKSIPPITNKKNHNKKKQHNNKNNKYVYRRAGSLSILSKNSVFTPLKQQISYIVSIISLYFGCP